MSKTLFLDDEQQQLLVEVLGTVPLNRRYLPFVADLIQRLEPEAGSAPSPGSTPPAVHSSPTGGGFQLIAHTWEGKALLATFDKIFSHEELL